MGTTWTAVKAGFGATAGYRVVDYFAGPTQDEKSRSRDRQAELNYRREQETRDLELRKKQHEQSLAAEQRENEAQRYFQEKQNEKDRSNNLQIERERNETEARIAEMDAESRRYEADQAREAAEETNRTRKEIAEADFQLRELHHQQRLCHEEEIARRQVNAQICIANKARELEKYLTEQKIDSDREIARFNSLSARETQILVARENAANILQDRFVQEALRNFPLNVSPIVLLRNRPHTLNRLLAFSTNMSENIDVIDVYEEVTSYAMSPEALNIFIAPVHIDSKIQNREQLSGQLWDSVYQNLESFFNTHYNRDCTSPVILYPTAWRKDAMAGTHACETLYYFLKDMPCLVLEPRFDGQKFSIVVSAWGLGYDSNNLVRSNIEFDINIDKVLADAAYERSKRSLELLSRLNDSIDERLVEIKTKLKQNITYYESLGIDKRDEKDMMNMNALGVYQLFNIEPIQDLNEVSVTITQHLTVLLAILADIHHLRSTDAEIRFPKIFKENFSELFEDKEFREQVFRWYETVYIRLRNQDNLYLTEKQQKDAAKIREAQIRNLAYILELIDENALSSEVDKAIADYAQERYGFSSDDIDEIWWKCIDEMKVEEIAFFEELKDRLPRNDKRRRRIINRIADLKETL